VSRLPVPGSDNGTWGDILNDYLSVEISATGTLKNVARPSDLTGLATDSLVAHNTGNETIAGVKTFTSAPVVPSSSFPESAVTNLTSDLSGKVGTSDSRLSDARTPTAHAPSHAPGGSDPLTYSLSGTLAARPAAGASNSGYFYLATDTNGGTIYQSNGSSWVQAAAAVTSGGSSIDYSTNFLTMGA